MITQEIRYTTTDDGVKIAWATAGSGPPIVKCANWLNHLEYDWESPVWRHVMRELSTDFRLIRYDQRGNGLSDLDVPELSVEAFVRDLEAVVDAADIETFTLLGISQGCMHSLMYTARHPERVERLILHGGYAAGHTFWETDHLQRRAALGTLMEQGWGVDNPAFRQVFSAMFFPDGDAATHAAWNELQRVTPAANAVGISHANGVGDARELLASIDVPVLVMHSAGEMAVPFERSREIAAGIRDARLVTLDSRNHLLLETEPAWPKWLREVRAFMGVDTREPVSVEDRAAQGRWEDAGRLLEPGERLNHYRIDRHIAAGGMGDVYQAHDTNLRRDVAVKILSDDFVVDDERLARFKREARMLAALNHPNIATIFDLESADGHHFIVMELAGGGTLRERLREGPLRLDESFAAARGIAAGLVAAHAKDIVHRDLKPSNVMLTEDGVKLLDFGIAKPVPAEAVTADVADVHSDDLTATGVLMGTGPYMSPEQVRGQEVGKASDIWSFGCVVYETLRGRSPFRRDTLADTLTAVLQHPPDLDALPGNTPRPLLELLGRCLIKDAGERDLRAQEAAAILERLRGSSDSGLFGWFKRAP